LGVVFGCFSSYPGVVGRRLEVGRMRTVAVASARVRSKKKPCRIILQGSVQTFVITTSAVIVQLQLVGVPVLALL
jgi:hypothetical protein